MHSKINFYSMEDWRINTLKEIRNWFVYGDKQKAGHMGWISPQCQFDLILSIDGFLGMLGFIIWHVEKWHLYNYSYGLP